MKCKLWNLGKNIEESDVIEIEYKRQGESNSKPIKRVVEPVAIIFSEYYFYLNAYIVEKNEKEDYQKCYRYPAIFRIDRITKYKKQDKNSSKSIQASLKKASLEKEYSLCIPETSLIFALSIPAKVLKQYWIDFRPPKSSKKLMTDI